MQELPNIFQQQQAQPGADQAPGSQPQELPNIFANQQQPDVGAKELAGGAVSGVADFLSGAVTGPMGGLHGISTFVATGDLDRAINSIEYWQKYTPGELAKQIGVPEQYIYNHAYDKIMMIPELVDKTADELGEWAREHSGEPGTASSMVGAATKATASLVTYLLGAKGAGAGIGKGRKIYKDARGKKQNASPERRIYENEKDVEEVASLVDDAINRKRNDTEKGPGGTGEVAELLKQDGPVDTLARAAESEMRGPPQEGTVNYGKINEPKADIQKTDRPPMASPDQSKGPQQPINKGTDFQKSVIPDNAAARLEEGMPAKGSPEQGVLPFVPNIKGTEKVAGNEHMSVGEGRQGSLNFGEDVLFTEGQNAYNKPGFMRSAEEVIHTRTFNKKMDTIEGRTNKGRQRGASNFGAAEWIVNKSATVGKRLKAFIKGGKFPEHFYVPREHMSGWEKLSPQEKAVVPDTRPLSEVFDSITETTKPTNKKNVTSQTKILTADGASFGDIGKPGAVLFTESNLRTFYDRNPIIKSTIDRLAEVQSKWNRVNEALRENETYAGVKKNLKGFTYKLFSPNLKSSIMRQESGVLGRIDGLKVPDKLGLFRVMNKFDNSPLLAKEGLQWPTRETLVKEGLNSEQVSIYQHYTKISDNLYDILDYAWRQAKPKHSGVRRIPGYFPHMYRGAYDVKIVDDKGNLAFYSRATSKAHAYKLWERIQQKAHMSSDPAFKKIATHGKMLEPIRKEHSTEVSSMVEAYENTLKMMDMNHGATKGISQLFDSIRASVNAGSISHAQNRAGVKGHLADTFWGDTQFVKESRKAMENYIHAVTEFAKKQEIIHKIENPLKAAQKKIEDMGLPNTFEFLRRRIEANKGTPVDASGKVLQSVEKSYNKVVESVTDMLTQGHLAPSTAKSQLQFVRSWFTSMKIGFYKPVYLAMNVLQPHFMGVPVMVREKARMGGKGNPWIEALKIDTNILDMPGFRASDEVRGVVLRGLKEKKLNPSLMENIDFITTKKLTKMERARRLITGRGTAEHIEAVGRMKSMVYAYKVYRNAGLSKEDSYHASTKVVDEIMMNYDKVKRPAAYQDYGLAGEAMSPFAVFAHGQLGNAVITAKVAARLVKEGKPIRALEPVFANAAVSMFFAGALGIVGLAELDLISKAINVVLNQSGVEFRMPEVSEWLSKSGNVEKLVGADKIIMGVSTHDSIRYGPVSAATRNIPGMEAGINIGSGMTSPAANDLISAPSLGWMRDLFMGDDSALMSSIRLGAGNATKNDYWNIANKLFIPSSMTGIAARAQAAEQGQFDWGTREDWVSKMTPKERDRKQPSAYPNVWQSGQGSVPMTPEDWRTRMFTGTKSLDETNKQTVRQVQKKAKLSRSVRISNLYRRAADAMESNKTIPVEVIEAAYNEGIMIHDLIRGAREKAWARPTGEVERSIGRTPTPQNRKRLLNLESNQ